MTVKLSVSTAKGIQSQLQSGVSQADVIKHLTTLIVKGGVRPAVAQIRAEELVSQLMNK